MSWPTPQDYNEALQSPRVNFDDAELKKGTPELTPLGLPRAITGGFASVYRIRTKSGQFAVRCFLRDFADNKERYAAISRHLAAAKLPYMVGFDFLEKGIRVRGNWYPILKMEWLEVSTFIDYIEANINNPSTMSTLADRWLALLRALKKHGIAHADLQHGNVLISNGDFRLIDYDGMFVPPLAGRASHEVGHRNYQHPTRQESDFGPHLDNFSGWLIYLTLVALSVDPGLWARFGRGEEHILFRKEDLDQPRFSRLFRSLEHLKDDRVQKYLPLFRSFIEVKLSSIVSAADVIGVPPKKRESRRPVPVAWANGVQLDLFAVKTEAAPKEEAREELAASTESAFNAELVYFNRSCSSERMLLCFYGVFILTNIALAAVGTIPATGAVVVLLGGLVCLVACLMCSYVSLNEVRAKLRVWLALELRRTQGELIKYGIARLARLISGIVARESRESKAIASRVDEHARQEKVRISEVKRTLASSVEELRSRKERLHQSEVDEVSRLVASLQSHHNDVLAQGAFLLSLPQAQLERPGLKSLLAWRTRVEELARVGPPLIVPARDQASIYKRFELEIKSIEQSELFAHEATKRKIQKIRATGKRARERMELRHERSRLAFERFKQFMQRMIERGDSWLRENEQEIMKQLAELNRYREIRLSRYLPHLFGASANLK